MNTCTRCGLSRPRYIRKSNKPTSWCRECEMLTRCRLAEEYCPGARRRKCREIPLQTARRML